VGRVVLLVLLSIPAGYACQAETQAAQEPPPAVAPAPAAQEKPSQNAPGNSDTDPAKPVPASAAGVDPKTFVIGAEDILTVRVWREPELSGQFMVRPDGRISLPLVNEILAAGQTPEQLTASIAQGLSKYMNRPEVAVVVAQVNSRKYYVQGEVNRPGAYPLVVPTTVLEALSNGGGFRDFANTKKIIILRNGKERLQFNYRDVTRGKHTEQNIVLQPGDQIIVN
jgi:polysaccharide biosynthesis/export protein